MQILVYESSRMRKNDDYPVWIVAGAAGCLIALALWPLAAFLYPGLQDYPNHLARAFILLHTSDTLFQQQYRISWSTAPNLGWDLWAVMVGPILGLEWTGKFFLALSAALTILGCFLLNRALIGRWTSAPLLAIPLLFNSGYARGFLSYGLGMGVALCAAATWTWLGEARWKLRLATGTLFSTILYFIHFYAWAVYGVYVLCSSIQPLICNRNWGVLQRSAVAVLRDGTQAIPTIIFFALAYHSAASEPTIDVFKLGDFKPPYIRFGQAARLMEVGPGWLGFVFLEILSLAIFIGFRIRAFQFNRPAILATIAFLTLFFALPDELYGTYYVSWRSLHAAALLAIASISTTMSRQQLAALAGLVASLTLTLSAFQFYDWRLADAQRQMLLRIVNTIPEGSKLFYAQSRIDDGWFVREIIGGFHLGSYAIISRHALVQSSFVKPGQQPLRFNDAWLQLAPQNSDTHLEGAAERFELRGLNFCTHLIKFDYVLIHGRNTTIEQAVLPMSNLSLLYEDGEFRLYNVRKDGGASCENQPGSPVPTQ